MTFKQLLDNTSTVPSWALVLLGVISLICLILNEQEQKIKADKKNSLKKKQMRNTISAFSGIVFAVLVVYGLFQSKSVRERASDARAFLAQRMPNMPRMPERFRRSQPVVPGSEEIELAGM